MRAKSFHPANLGVCLLLAALVLSVGCTASETNGTQVSGSVTVGGSPLKSGSITFEPDSKQGNSGPAAITPVVDGKYQTDPKRGVGKGAYVVRITPPDVESGSDVSAVVMKKPYTTSVQIEPNKTTYDFDVPKP
ncbi:hypothetical protein Pan97_00940 [Bremerella volcania]|uniref:Carboxypeptidase regulatory-like domain-containing protein n=1 Tax=Bremerella volcania TaxID=2527984 RepID=A0A518C1N2_9BACT|nr:hypothetical protein [Bremerella volcania]QDU73127.1 hypothetical protein Pan97_00940 [Bremerella volcania]